MKASATAVIDRPPEAGTRVTYTASYDLDLPPLLGRALSPLADRFNRRELEATLQNLDGRL